MKNNYEMKKNEKGFTLIELIIVIAILAIIAAVAVPNILGAVDNSRKATDVSNAKIIANAAAQVMAKNEKASTAKFVNGSELAVTGLESTGTDKGAVGADANDAFAEALYLELNSNPPKPVYQGIAAVTETNFYLQIENNIITVEVGSGADNVEILPKDDPGNYDQQ